MSFMRAPWSRLGKKKALPNVKRLQHFKGTLSFLGSVEFICNYLIVGAAVIPVQRNIVLPEDLVKCKEHFHIAQ